MTKDTIGIFSNDYYTLCEGLSKIKRIMPQKNDEKTYKFYHYTSINVFHNIVDNCEFWAHNTRFSNDYTEEKSVNEQFLSENNYISDNYFICLSENGDLLSQWRGYCMEGGVSIELSLPKKDINFTVLGNNAPDVQDFYGRPLPIGYLIKGKNGLHNELRGKLEFMPLLKKSCFSEEREYRILFNNKNHFLDKCIFERELDNSTRVPYLKVRFNRTDDFKSKKISTLQDLEYEDLKMRAVNLAKDHFLSIPACSQQESICNTILAKLDEYNKCKEINPKAKRMQITLLCEGKPPITGITIAPMYDKERVREQIEHFCKTRYWLRDVPVECSKIPYTFSLGKK